MRPPGLYSTKHPATKRRLRQTRACAKLASVAPRIRHVGPFAGEAMVMTIPTFPAHPDMSRPLNCDAMPAGTTP